MSIIMLTIVKNFVMETTLLYSLAIAIFFLVWNTYIYDVAKRLLL